MRLTHCPELTTKSGTAAQECGFDLQWAIPPALGAFRFGTLDLGRVRAPVALHLGDNTAATTGELPLQSLSTPTPGQPRGDCPYPNGEPTNVKWTPCLRGWWGASHVRPSTWETDGRHGPHPKSPSQARRGTLKSLTPLLPGREKGLGDEGNSANVGYTRLMT